MNELVFVIHVCLISIPFVLKDRLESVACLCGLSLFFANFFVLKEITLCGISTTCVEPFTLITFLVGNHIHNVRGARAAYLVGCHTMVVFLWILALYYVSLLYTPGIYDVSNTTYLLAGKHLWHTALYSCIAFACSYTIERIVYNVLKSSHMVRSSVSFFASQIFDTALFSILLFGHTRPLYAIVQLSIWSFFIKMCAFSITTFLLKHQNEI